MRQVRIPMAVSQNHMVIDSIRQMKSSPAAGRASALASEHHAENTRLLACRGWEKIRTTDTADVRRFFERIEADFRPNKTVPVALGEACDGIVSEALRTFAFLGNDPVKAIRLALMAAHAHSL